MRNPWTQVPLEVYEAHMGLESVAQLQMLNQLMKAQWEAYPDATSAAVLGVAGGNGLEHCRASLERVVGIDINPEYLVECARRFRPILGSRLELLQMDLVSRDAKLPKVDLLIADLLIEYVGVETFCAKAAESQAHFISCVIQLNAAQDDFVSASPYQARLAAIGVLHQDVDEHMLTEKFAGYCYCQVLRDIVVLPNGKRFVRLDYEKGRKSASEKTLAIIQNEWFCVIAQ